MMCVRFLLFILSFISHGECYSNSFVIKNNFKNNIKMSIEEREKFKNELPGKFLVAGRKFYVDPFGISKSASIDSIKLWREAEIMHGRVSMLSFIHVLVTEFYKYHPLQKNIDDLAINHLGDTSLSAIFTLGTCVGALEFYRADIGWLEPTKPENLWKLRDTYEPGNLGFDPLQFNNIINSSRKLKEQELNNGRLAAIAMVGIVCQEVLTQKPVFN